MREDTKKILFLLFDATIIGISAIRVLSYMTGSPFRGEVTTKGTVGAYVALLLFASYVAWQTVFTKKRKASMEWTEEEKMQMMRGNIWLGAIFLVGTMIMVGYGVMPILVGMVFFLLTGFLFAIAIVLANHMAILRIVRKWIDEEHSR